LREAVNLTKELRQRYFLEAHVNLQSRRPVLTPIASHIAPADTHRGSIEIGSILTRPIQQAAWKERSLHKPPEDGDCISEGRNWRGKCGFRAPLITIPSGCAGYLTSYDKRKKQRQERPMPCAIIGCHPEEQLPFSGQLVHVGRDSRTPGVEFPFSSFSKLDAWSGFVQPSITASFSDHHFAAFLGPVPAGIF